MRNGRPLILALALLLSACASRPIPLPELHSRDLIRDRLVRDSIYIRDSIYVHLKGDTVWRDRTLKIYDRQQRVLHDTLVIRDSIPYPVEVLRTVEVDKPLRWWEKTLIGSGILLWTLILGRLAYKTVKRKITLK